MIWRSSWSSAASGSSGASAGGEGRWAAMSIFAGGRHPPHPALAAGARADDRWLAGAGPSATGVRPPTTPIAPPRSRTPRPWRLAGAPRQPVLQQHRRRARVLRRAAAAARGDAGREALVVELDRDGDELAEALRERPRRSRLVGVGAAQRERQPDHDPRRA